MPARPSLYSSPIQHVLVLQEEDSAKAETPPELKPWNDGLTRAPTTPPPVPNRDDIPYLWRIRDRMRTSHGALVLCLNIGFDPSDVSKPSPCAKLQCWVDPNVDTPVKSLQHIANTLKGQYERWQPKTRYKLAPDPTVTELKRICVNLRRAAKDERVLFHYNGHGVPKPTDQGEIWVFNHNYTHYIPFNLLDLNEVLGSPSLYIFDCNSAGTIFEHFKRVNSQFERHWEEACRKEGRQVPPPPHRNSVFLGACAPGELLPTTPSLPADLFTSCLTTPLKTALHWFIKRTLVRGVTTDMLDRIPGNLNSRHTPLGELNWIFTAITDTIAWNVLPREMFKKLYRQDMLLASLMRNFLLADRIMRCFSCHPVSHPALPETHAHPLWESFELSMEQLLAQLPMMLAEEEAKLRRQEEEAELHAQNLTHHVRFAVNGEDPRHGFAGYNGRSANLQNESGSKPRYRYRPCSFFEDQMRAFDVWLDMGPEQRNGPEQLPVMLQVLLSPTLRIKALPIISRYLQTGPVAVDQALAIGIFPYVLRLLQSQSVQMQQDLVFIWSKILALDDSCRSDLVKDKGEEYFVRFLMPGRGGEEDPKPVYLAVAMFVLSVIAKDYADRCRAVGTLEACYSRLSHESPFVRRWACLCLTEVIKRAPVPSQSQALAWEDLVKTLSKRATNDEASDVRAASVSTLSAIMNGVLKNIPGDGSDPSSTDLRSDFQAGIDVSEPRDISSERDMLGMSLDASNGLMSQDTKLNANGNFRENDFSMTLGADFLDAPVPAFQPEERDALLSIGKVIAEGARWESSVLVRREVAIAISKAATYREGRFIRAAYVSDVMGCDEEEESITFTDLDKCEAVYRRLWTSLSELAYDPHPIIAALARRSYDLISEKIHNNTGATESVPSEEIVAEGHMLPPSRQDAISNKLNESSVARREVYENVGSPAANEVKEETLSEWYKLREGSREKLSKEKAQGPFPLPIATSGNKAGDATELEGCAALSPEKRELLKRSSGREIMMQRMRKRLGPLPSSPVPRQDESGTKFVHVRSSSGSFSLDPPSRRPLVRIPRVNSAGLIPLRENLADATESEHTPPLRSRSNLTGSFDLTNISREDERPRSVGQLALAKGVGTLVKTVSQHFNLAGFAGSPAKDRTVGTKERTRESQEDKQNAMSPPRPPKRSLSYQVLNAATALSPQTEAVMFGMSRHTSYVKSSVPLDQSSTRNAKVPNVFDRLYLSGGGDAALSLFEWSSAYISKVEATATSDSIHEEESIPRYAVLWHKFTTSGGDVPVEDNLRAFARLGESDSLRLGPIVNANEEGNDFDTARQLSLCSMGAGGGSITAMAFLPRDSGMGDDHLLATGDSTGSVGVYDIRSGICQGSFGVPSPPGIPEVGVKSVLCLNSLTTTTKEGDGAQPNSRSALILAGAYDGRVAVFKSNFTGRKYRIMSTFQASGQSFWSKAGTNRDSSRKVGSASPSPSGQGSPAVQTFSQTATEGPFSFAQAVRDSGNGLALAFDADSSYLAAGGCDAEVVRVWDLHREQCVWEGPTVEKGTWPTALCTWNRLNPNLFVVGSSDGDLNLIDLRERALLANEARNFRRLGSHSQPIISVGTCPHGKDGEGEAVVAADIGGEMVFWEPRWNGRGRCSSSTGKNDETTRIKAHSSNVAAMAVHPSGRYVASGSSFGTTGKRVKIFGPNRRMVKMISHFERPGGGLFPYNDNRISPVTSLTFEHETSLLAIGFIDSSVMIYGRPEHFSGI